jgi:CRP-like cAMP-binding protein
MTYPQTAEIRRLRTKKQKLDVDKASQVRQLVLALDLPSDTENRILSALDYATAHRDKTWEFVMIDVHRHNDIINFLFEKAQRPKLSVRLYNLLFSVANHSTGRVIASQKELAEALGCRVQEISTAMTELVDANIILRQRHGRSVAYFFNPNLATSLAGPERALAQKAAGELRLVS